MRRVSKLWVLFVTIALCGCLIDKPLIQNQTKNVQSIEEKGYIIKPSESLTLQSWWNFFNDDVLNDFISSALNLNQVTPAPTVLGQGQDSPTYETLLQESQDQKADLIHEITQHYLKFRYIQNQHALLNQYTIERKAFYAGDIETIKGNPQKFSTSSAEIETLEKQQKNFLLQQKNIVATLARYTKLLPEYVEERLKDVQDMPNPDITPILASDVAILESAKKIAVAQAFYNYKQSLFADQAIGHLYGISDEVFTNNRQSWRVQPGHAGRTINLPDSEEFQTFRKHILEYVLDIERRMTAYAHLREQQTLLQNSAKKARVRYNNIQQYEVQSNTALKIAQDDANKTTLSALKAKYEMSKVLIDLYHAIGAY